jgi:hypothetical protein
VNILLRSSSLRMAGVVAAALASFGRPSVARAQGAPPALPPAPVAPAAVPPDPVAPAALPPALPPPAVVPPPSDASSTRVVPPAGPVAEKASEPFAYGDFTWLNGTNRQKKSILDSEVFTGSFLLDIDYTMSNHRPIDHTVVGSTTLSRDNEFTIAFLGFGGDFHYQHARGRLMTQFGLRSTVVPRNDFSVQRGQFQLDNALRYVSEAYGGYP